MAEPDVGGLELRPVTIDPGYISHAEGSCMISMGETTVLCTASVEERVPAFLEGRGRGWVTAEYGMLPRSTHSRQERERSRGSPNSRALEISRLIGRALRISLDLEALGERTVILDCDVIKADGGTRCCAVNGAFVALYQALDGLVAKGILDVHPNHTQIAAVSVGIVDGEPAVDLDYSLDCRADVDLNVVMTGDGRLVEIQGTAEKKPFDKSQLQQMLHLAGEAVGKLIAMQRKALGL